MRRRPSRAAGPRTAQKAGLAHRQAPKTNIFSTGLPLLGMVLSPGDSAQDLRILVAPRCTCKFVQSWLVSRLQHMLRSSPGFVSVSMHETYNRWAPQLVPKLEDGAWQSAPKAPQLGRSWNDASRSLEAVALAAAADTTARIRAASTCSTRTPSGTGRRSVSAIDDSSPDKTVHYGAPWVAAVPLTPLWHAVPLLPQGPRADQVSPLRDRELQQARDLRAEREEADTLRRHKEELQFELADLRKRLSQAAGLLQHARKQTGVNINLIFQICGT